jgi:prepilin peptidase CpaA
MSGALAIALALGLLAMAVDLRRRVLPNWLTLSGAGAGLLLAAPHGWHAMWLAAAGAAVGFAILLPFFVFGGMGGGDVKLMAAFGALLGPTAVLVAALFATLLGSAEALVVVAVRPRTAAIPYAPPIVLGAWMILVAGGA